MQSSISSLLLLSIQLRLFKLCMNEHQISPKLLHMPQISHDLLCFDRRFSLLVVYTTSFTHSRFIILTHNYSLNSILYSQCCIIDAAHHIREQY